MVGVVVPVVVLVGVQWFRPLPAATLRGIGPQVLRVAGTPPPLPWPATGAGALVEVGAGSLGAVGSTQPAPIASLAKVLTAYVVLQDHPLAPGADGPAIPVPPQIVANDRAGVASGQSEVAVAQGETLTEAQALQGLLVASGNDIALLLAQWDAGTTAAFVAKMNAVARTLGLTGTRITDPSGLDPETVSTPSDLVRLGQLAMAIPVFRQVVGMPQVTLPVAGTVPTYDHDLGRDGFVGIKTGFDSAAGGCFLFEADTPVGHTTVSFVGVVLGQHGADPNAAALDVADRLVRAAEAQIRPLPLAPAGERIATLTAPWGASVPVVMATSPTVVGWPGLAVPFVLRPRIRTGPVAAGVRVGTLSVHLPQGQVDVGAVTRRTLPGPGVVWRLTRL